ncbi:MAG TPA: PIN domain-containing protein [Povalibacter sp.]|uniref:type II toxin-antitoxin system VapC family toxin n=1 Tax=Povalibacter sp. TaxID=1962978 RepID=UPI002BFBB6C8|nr:PIN domain-containing protein [Povalibacter sp.]HMN42934.1 PIN domain-containing protein [Povalibacter sp.]
MSTKKIYLDACCFIELALDANGKQVHDGGKFLWHLKTALRAGRDKRLTVVTSLFSIVECTSADGDISEETQRIFRSILTSGSGGVTPWQTDIFVLERARDLRWKYEMNLRPADALHVASAIDAQCDEFWTWDGVGKSAKSILNAKAAIARQGVAVVVPSDTQCIPSEYRQGLLPIDQKPEAESPATPG